MFLKAFTQFMMPDKHFLLQMLHQFLRMLILLMGTDVYPRAIQGIANDLLTLGNEFLYKMGGMEEGVFRYLSEGTLLDEVDAGIGIVVILWLLYQSFDVAPIEVEDTQLYAHIVGNSSYRHLGIILFKMKVKVLVVNIGEEVRIHH